MQQDSSFAGVTYEVLEFISEVKIKGENGYYLKLKEKDGSPKIKACMVLLGFSKTHVPELVLREEKEIKDRLATVYIRDQSESCSMVLATVYNSKLREDYEPLEELYPYLKKILFDGDIMQMKSFGNNVKVDTVGNEYSPTEKG